MRCASLEPRVLGLWSRREVEALEPGVHGVHLARCTASRRPSCEAICGSSLAATTCSCLAWVSPLAEASGGSRAMRLQALLGRQSQRVANQVCSGCPPETGDVGRLFVFIKWCPLSHRRPSIIISYIVAGLACTFAAAAYGELSVVRRFFSGWEEFAHCY